MSCLPVHCSLYIRVGTMGRQHSARFCGNNKVMLKLELGGWSWWTEGYVARFHPIWRLCPPVHVTTSFQTPLRALAWHPSPCRLHPSLMSPMVAFLPRQHFVPVTLLYPTHVHTSVHTAGPCLLVCKGIHTSHLSSESKCLPRVVPCAQQVITNTC